MDHRYYTLAEGCPYASNATSVQLRDGRGGGLSLLQDTQLIETLAHFSWERIPERVVHAKAAGAYGGFTVTKDCSDITSASFLNKVGKTTPVLWRVSTVGPESGSADTLRDVHGWAMKFYTDEGNLDWVFNNTSKGQPVFFVRDPMKFPSLNRSHKRHPRTHLPNSDMEYLLVLTHADLGSFHNGSPESFHELLHLFSDRGTPASLRNMNAYGGHTYKLTTTDGAFKYVKFHIKTNQGVRNFTREEAEKMAGQNPDFLIHDMFDAIERKDYPSWTVFVQVMDPSQAENYRWNIFDMTKVWAHKDFPLRELGKLTLNRNPNNYFTDIEQAAFSPSTMVPGIAPSADPMLQARMFAYPDAARYRLGVNYQQLPTNAAKCPVYSPLQRDGKMNFSDNYGADPNYVGSSLQPTNFYPKLKGVGPNTISTQTEHEKWAGQISTFATQITDDDFVQPAALWEVIKKQPGHEQRFYGNVAAHLSKVTSDRLRNDIYFLILALVSRKPLRSLLLPQPSDQLVVSQTIPV
ncbi:catalase [Microsporum canis CBS 113480]|uniref:Catalase n=1 Tax=Arthroderma otae (strain ATCC MYA-4605 / CBS 113480) TaxID=554155 RepID=C5FJ02_ARTOC|nr:catalase [Microsporum canis CBS 113480]EEQ29332.1 catalase [Microsporum canis CBS 113480]